jgi:hypothetical protein
LLVAGDGTEAWKPRIQLGKELHQFMLESLKTNQSKVCQLLFHLHG